MANHSIEESRLSRWDLEYLRINPGFKTPVYCHLSRCDCKTPIGEIVRPTEGEWLTHTRGIFTLARRTTLPGLTPGQVYSVQSRTIGGATGYSDWNGPVSHMVI